MIGNIKTILYNTSREKCTCEMIKFNGIISVLNYFSMNQSCQLFDNNRTTIYIKSNQNSSLIFINQTTLSITKLPISSFAVVTASNYLASAGSPTAQGDGLVDRPNSSDGTYFNSGGNAPQYIQLELPGVYNIYYVCLRIAQSPSGNTEHHLYVGSDLNHLTLATNISGVTSSGQWINITYNPPLIGIQFLHLNSISSPSWIAWVKFIIYDYYL
ncbi:hypothetical protein I4U23_004384 [Adineta vaga]|nr:hypothetical protein I4U23_004384 [Adineta vaga]